MSERKVDFAERRIYFARKLTDYLSDYPQNFRDFVGDQAILDFGDKLLSHGLTTGYNFATDAQFPITSNEPLILYSVYAQRVLHFGELLARMENEGIIKEKDVSFGIKAAKIIGDYTDPEPIVSQIMMMGGYPLRTMESIEAVVVFHPLWQGQAINIVRFLTKEALTIEGGYEDPDTRATNTEELRQIFIKTKLLELAVANIFEFERGNLITLRQITPFGGKGWKSIGSLIHPRLYKYLTSMEVAA